MRKLEIVRGILFAVILALLFYFVWEGNGQDYYLVSLLIIVISLFGFFFSFEKSKPGVALLTMISGLIALAVASRIVFFFLPQVKPIAAVIILIGISFGADAGFVSGALAAFVSNFYFGQGSWTPFQMFALGLIGFFSGVLLKNRHNKWIAMLYGFFSVLLIYGGIVDLNTLYFTSRQPTKEIILAVYAQGLPFDLIFAASTSIFLFVLYTPITKTIGRIQQKYRLIDKEAVK